MDELDVPTLHDAEDAPKMTTRQRVYIIGAAILGMLLLSILVLAVTLMVRNPDQTETIRDIVIIFMAVESLLIGVALIILVIQLARLTALLQNEVTPILESTNETLNTLRGTTRFLSNALVEPVIKANSSLAVIQRALRMIRPGRSR